MHPVRPDDQVGLKLAEILHPVFIAKLHAQRFSPRLQSLQQLQPPDRREADPVEHHHILRVVERHVAPALHLRRDQVVGLRIIRLEEAKGLLGEDHPEPPGRIARTSLSDPDPCGRQPPSQQNRGVQSSRTSAQNFNGLQKAHGFSSCLF